MSKAVANLTQLNETITFSAQDNGETINVKINELARGPAGADGPNSVTSATTSDGTANLSLSNVTTATATVTGTLTADHIHGNVAGSIYAHVRAGESLAKGDPVYVSGSHGTGANLIAIVSKANASDPLKMPAVGIMDAALANNASGHMVIVGQVYDFNTAAYPVNGELYVAEGGGLTATPPNAYAQPVARVERSNTNNGAVIVKVNGLSAISPTASTLVRRDSSGVSDFNTINLGNLHTGGSPSAPYGSIGKNVLTGSSGVGISGNPEVALEAATHRLTLSSSGIALTSGTITTSQPLSLTQTWNAAGVTFKGIDVNVTDTASASGSLLMDLRVGGNPYFSIEKDGSTRLYRTYSSSTNFERLNFKYTGTAFQIGTEKGSAGGTARPLEFQTDGTTRMTLTTGGDLNLSASSASVVYGISITNSSSSSSAGSRITVKNDQNKGGSFGTYSSTFGFGLAGNAGFGAENSVVIYSDSDLSSGGTGSIQFRAGGYNTNQERFRITATGLVTFGGTTSSFPALKRSSAILQARLADDSAYTTIDAQHRLQGTAPASATAAGTAGDIRYDADYIYICTATNTWKRAAIATWP